MRFSGFDELLSYWAQNAPDRPALVYERGGSLCTCTFRELRERVLVRANELGREPGLCRGVLCDGSFACVIEIFATVIFGKRLVLLNENASDAALADMVREAEISSLWGDPDLVSDLTPCLEPNAEGGPARVLFFTSGTTSRSKAVVLTSASLMSSAYNGSALLPLRPEDRLLCMLPLDHVFGFVCGLLWGLSCGASVALGRGARHYVDDCAFFTPTAISAVPLLLGFLLQHQALNPELKLILVGAGGCPKPILDAARAMGKAVHFGYGLTETSSGVALSLGSDPYAMTVCPDDTIDIAPDGEVLISAPTCVMEGYWRRPTDTGNVLRGGILHTGDLGRLDWAGRLILTGRKKEMLVLMDGTKLYLPEYEGAIARALGTPNLCVVLEDKGPVLVLEGPEQETAPLWEKLRPVMAELPRGQQLRNIAFYGAPLPRTASGKIMRWAVQREGKEEK
jgi:long-subunit acyl-CoA synthetase (AMP-forming)